MSQGNCHNQLKEKKERCLWLTLAAPWWVSDPCLLEKWWGVWYSESSLWIKSLKRHVNWCREASCSLLAGKLMAEMGGLVEVQGQIYILQMKRKYNLVGFLFFLMPLLDQMLWVTGFPYDFMCTAVRNRKILEAPKYRGHSSVIKKALKWSTLTGMVYFSC